MTTTETAANVDAWIAQEYDNIKAYLIRHDTFDPDTFHDAYLSLSDAVTPEVDITLYRKLFDAIYAELRKNKVWQSFRSVNVQEILFNLLKSDDETESDEEHQAESKPDITAQQVRSYARHNLTGEEYSLFALRYEHGMTLQQIGLYIGKGKDFVKLRTTKICDTIRTHFNKKVSAI